MNGSKILGIENLLRNGADKVSINTWGVKAPDLLKQASKEFDSQHCGKS